MSETYNIIFNGVLPEYAEQSLQVEQQFAALFSLSPEKTRKLFLTGHGVVLRKGLDAQAAVRYRDKLHAIGVQAALVAIKAPVPISAEALVLQPIERDMPADPEQAFSLRRERHADGGFIMPAHHKPRHDLLPFEFRGNGAEYFRIWIVNLFLSIITLGVYSAWAKVRKKQYFYGNTLLDGSTFEYSASPLKILLGRVISLLLLIAYIGLSNLSLAGSVAATLLLFVLLPWIITKSLRFNARYSSYRNLRFQFQGKVADAFAAFVLWPLVAVLSVGLLLPYAIYKQQQFMVGNHAYGSSRFSLNAQAVDYYRVFFVMFGVAFMAGLLVVLLSFLGWELVMMPLIFLLYLLSFTYFTVAMTNIRYNNTVLQEHSFAADWGLWSYTRLFVENSLLTVLTLGLFIPWAQVRTARYKAEHVSFVAQGSVDDFVAGEAEKAGALGEGISDLFDIEIGL